ncbi:Hypothetical protein, putative, partial [Bodo saltans]
TLLRTSPMSWRKETVRKLLKKWHLHERRGPAGEEPDVTLMYDLVALTVRAGLADEEARRGDAQHHKSGGRRPSIGYAVSVGTRRASDRVGIFSAGNAKSVSDDDVLSN